MRSFFRACRPVCFCEHTEVLLFVRGFVHSADRFSEYYKMKCDFPDHSPECRKEPDGRQISCMRECCPALQDLQVHSGNRFHISFVCTGLPAGIGLLHVPYRQMHSWRGTSVSAGWPVRKNLPGIQCGAVCFFQLY